MKITFEGPAILVSDMKKSRTFYEKVLGQEVMADFGQNIPFTSGFSIWQADHATGVIFSGGRKTPSPLAQNNFELYFECADLDAIWAKVEAAGAETIHPITEAPWGQRGFRLRDPDGHIVEIGEPLTTLVTRLAAEGLTHEEISCRTSIPVEMVASMAES